MPIESVAAGDLVKSFDPDTGIVSEQLVEETFIKESSELVHVKTGTETITATTNHPFYVPKKGFVEAIKLRAGDRLQTVNGEYVIVEQVQHEILEAPVKVYNFRVANNHTYYVGENAVGVHNNGGCPGEMPNGGNGKSNSIDDIVKGLKETTNGKGIARNFESSGGYKQTLKDFNKLNPTDIKDIQTQYGKGKVGILEDGTKVIARPGSKTGEATLEIQISNKKIYKIRY